MDCCRRQFACSQDVKFIEVLFMRRLFASLSLLILTVSPRTHASQSATSSPRTAEDSNICDRSLYNPTLDDSAFNVWSNDTSYTVTKTTDATTKLDSYYITGDILRINEEQFP